MEVLPTCSIAMTETPQDSSCSFASEELRPSGLIRYHFDAHDDR